MADLLKKKSYSEAVSHGEAIINADPLREEVHRALMLCFWKLGDSARAIRQFQLCARLMQEELGILPLPETIALYSDVVESRVGSVLDQSSQGNQDQRLQEAYQSFQVAASKLEELLSS